MGKLTILNGKNHYFYDHLAGWWLSHLPLWKMMEWVRQLGLRHSQLNGEIKKNVPNHQPENVFRNLEYSGKCWGKSGKSWGIIWGKSRNAQGWGFSKNVDEWSLLVQVMREWLWGKIWNSLMDGMIAFVGFGYCVLTKIFPSFIILSVFKWWFSERLI